MIRWARLAAGVVLLALALLLGRVGYTVASFTATKSYDSQVSTAANFPAPVSVVVLSISPYDGMTSVPINNAVAFNFSVAMDRTSSQNAFTLAPCTPNSQACAGLGASVTGAYTWTTDSKAFTFKPPSNLSSNQWYKAAITTTATSATGGPLASAASVVFQTAATPDTTAPVIVPPLIPASAATNVPGSSKITLTFSEAMQQSTIMTAFSLRPCTDVNCTAAGPAVAGSFSWSGANANIMTYTPAVTLTNSTTFIVQVANTAADLANNMLSNSGTPLSGGACAAGAFCYKLTTAATPGCIPSVPITPTVTAPPSIVWTSQSVYSVAGTTTANALVQVLTDYGARGTIDVTDTVRASQQLQGGNTSFVIAVPLAIGITNTFQAVAVDACGTRSMPAIVPNIVQGEVRTVAGSIRLNAGSDNIVVSAPFTADANGNGSATVQWRQIPGGVFSPAQNMGRSASDYHFVITGLAASTNYEVRVTYSDPNGVLGTAVQTDSVRTSADGFGNISVEDHSPPGTYASRAQSISIPITGLDPDVQWVQIAINTSPPAQLGCEPVSGGTANVAWNGKDGNGNWAPDGVYSYTIKGWGWLGGFLCPNWPQATGSNSLTIDNTAAVVVSAAAAAVTLHPGQSTAVYATVYNRSGQLLTDGALVTWSARSSGGTVFSGTPTPFSRTTSTTGTSYPGECTVGSGSGQACFKFTLPNAWTTIETVAITATVASQTVPGNTATTVSGSTTVNAVHP